MVASALLLHWTLLLASGQPTCADASSCRLAALDAAERKDYETFHDLSWRAVQKGRPNDADLMLLLARAQSLSGRPGDALVMLRRLAEMGSAVDGVEGEDFRRVRALPGWPAVETAIAAARDKAATVSAAAERRTPAAKNPPVKPTPLPAAASAAVAPSPPASAAASSARETPAAAAATTGGSEALRLTTTAIDTIGLAYDSASRRFVVGDRHRNKLIVADEVFKRVNDLIGAGSGGFGALTALEIDRRRGDLWVTSSSGSGGASLHRLQLVSGRVLAKVDLPRDLGAVAIGDIAVSDSGALLLLDTAGARLLKVSASTAFDRAVTLGLSSPYSIAAAGSTTYIAHDSGLSLVDGKRGGTSPLRAAQGVTLTGLKRIRWHRGSIIAIQNVADSRTRLVRLRISATGRTVSKLDVLDDATPEDGSALTISNNDAYYLAHAEDGPVIRRVPLR